MSSIDRPVSSTESTVANHDLTQDLGAKLAWEKPAISSLDMIHTRNTNGTVADANSTS